jgi:type I restriction enzyme S subunit
MVPNGWKLSTIKEVSNVSSGGTPSRKNDNYWGGDIPWATTAEVQFKTIFDTAQMITEEGLNNSSAKLFPVDTILMAMYGQGKTRGQVAKIGIETTTNQACAAIILKDGYDVDYYYQFLMSRYEHIRQMSNSGGQENLSAGIVKSIQVPVPPLPEQKEIAQILSSWDKAITTTEQLLANSQQQKKAIMQQLLTGKKRLLDGNGVRFSGDWKGYQLEELESLNWVELSRGKVISKKDIECSPGSYPIYSSSVKNNGLMGTYGDFMFDEELISWSIDGGGNLFYRPKHKFSVTNVSGYMRLDTKHLDYRFIASQLELIHTRLQFDYQSKAHPSVIRKLYKLAIPKLEEQQKIASVLSNADQEIEALKQKINYLKQEKKALMQQLLTGKRRVKVEVA